MRALLEVLGAPLAVRSIARSSRALLPGLAILLMSARSELHAATQEPVVLSRGTCQECSVALTPVVTLGTLDGPGAIGPLATMTRLADGRYAVGSAVSDAEIVVFSPDGNDAQVVGREGDGPGEFRFVRWLRASGRNLHVFDAQALRHTVFSPQFEVLRTSTFAGSPLGDVTVVDDSTIVMNSHIRTQERAGYLLHVFDEAGELVRSFADDPSGHRLDAPGTLHWRTLANSASGGVWSAHMTSYRLDEWSVDGTLLRSFAGGAPWFEPHDGRYGPPDPSRPPPPRILDIHADAADRLWVLMRVPSPDWKEALVARDAADHPEVGAFRIGDLNRAYDTIIEVIDISTRRVAASSRLDPALIEFVGDDQVVSTSEDTVGVPRLHIWRLSFHEPGNSPGLSEYLCKWPW